VIFSGPLSVFHCLHVYEYSWVKDILFQCRITRVDSNEGDGHWGRALKYLIEFTGTNLWNFLNFVSSHLFSLICNGGAATWLAVFNLINKGGSLIMSYMQLTVKVFWGWERSWQWSERNVSRYIGWETYCLEFFVIYYYCELVLNHCCYIFFLDINAGKFLEFQWFIYIYIGF
jgi:hypothetical protein